MSVFDRLAQTGELHWLDDGRLVLQGRPLALLQWLDARFAAMAGDAEAIQLPSIIDRTVLERAGFFEAFGERVTSIGSRHALTPALCYHAYARLAGRRLDTPIRWTTVGRCYRTEPAESLSPLRLWEFTMREVVFIGPRDWVAAERERWTIRLPAFAGELGLASALAVATDPFFLPASRGRQLMQQLKELKYELRVPVTAVGVDVAVASMNLHETFFGSRFGLTLADGSPAWSGCVAFGLERWTLALLAQLGLERAEALAMAGSA